MISKQKADDISTEIIEAVDAILAKHGMARGATRSTYGDAFTFKVEACNVTLGEGGVNLASTEAQDYKRYSRSYGLNEGLLGKAFTANGQRYTFAGIATRRHKYPIYALDSAGRGIFFTTSVVERLNA